MSEENTSTEQNNSEDNSSKGDTPVNNVTDEQNSGNAKETDDKGEYTPEQKTIKKSNKNNWSIADKINFGMLVFTAGLFVITGYSTYLTRQAITSSDSTNKEYIQKIQKLVDAFDTSANTNKQSFELAKKSLEVNIANNQKKYSTDSSNLSNQQKSIDETKNEFELENRPYIQLGDFYYGNVDSSAKGYGISIDYKIVNFGKFPAKILNITYDNLLSAVEDTNYINNYKRKYARKENTTIGNVMAGGLPINNYIDSISANAFQRIIKGELRYYLFGEIKYMCPITGKYYFYEFTYRLDFSKVKDISIIRNNDYEY